MSSLSRRETVAMLAIGGGVAACAGVPAPAAGAGAASGRGRFDLVAPFLDTPMRVWTYRPATATADSRIVMVMHGQSRNADDYRDAWVDLAEAMDLIIVAPEFDREHFPGSRAYNLGWMFGEDGKPRPRADWSFSVVDLAFDAAVARFGSRRTTYAMFGHSAGAQFVHRFMLFMPGDRVEAAVSANAGWYTLPTADQPFPWGLAGAGVGQADIKAWLGKPLVVLLGEDDTNPNQDSLNRDPEVMPQGPHRLARGYNFFETGRREAGRLGAPFAWRLQTVPDVAHSGSRMAPAAAALLTATPA